MWTSHDTVGFVFLLGFCVRFGISFEGTFTDLPVNLTAKEGQNIEMACAFQSGAPSVYLEMQWWFIRAPEEPTDSEEEEEEGVEPEEVEIIQEEPDPDDEGTKISTVRVQGNNISHKLQLSRIVASDEGLYECRVTRADYGEIAEYKAQAWLKVNATARPRHRPPPPRSANNKKSSSPLHLTDKKPRKSSGNHTPDQRVEEDTSTTSHTTSSKTDQHNPSSGTRTPYSCGLAALLLACGLVTDML